MKTINVKIDGIGSVRISDSNYVASGGEGTVYKVNSNAIKIYHDAKKMIPVKKIQELSIIPSPNVLAPKKVVYDDQNDPIGYMTTFVSKTQPLCKYFTKGFRDSISFDETKTINLVKAFQDTIKQIHGCNILIVDLNEMNFIINDKHDTPYFIDVDSYQTPSFKATALMESVRDRKVKNQVFTTDSDWFSFAIVAFQLYIGIHPYKGMHPNYSPKEWSKRMDDNVSVFDKKSKIPGFCRQFTVIPKSHLRWFEDVLQNGQRCEPPLPGDVAIVIPSPVNVIHDKSGFIIEKIDSYTSNIKNVFNYNGEKFVITNSGFYMSSRGSYPTISFDQNNQGKQLVCEGSDGEIFVVLNENGKCDIKDCFGTKKAESFEAEDTMVRDGRLYVTNKDSFQECSFYKTSNSVIPTFKNICKIMRDSSVVYDGVIYQDMIGSPYFTIPYQKGMTWFKEIPELRGFRVLNAKCERNVLVVVAEKSASYYRFVIIFDEKFIKYSLRKDDTNNTEISFTKIANGPCILLDEDTMEIFVDNLKVKRIENCPVDSSMNLFNFGGNVYFTKEKEIFSIKMK